MKYRILCLLTAFSLLLASAGCKDSAVPVDSEHTDLFLEEIIIPENTEPVLQSTSVSTTVASFPDVKSGTWYYDVVTTMATRGYLYGSDDGNFYPNKQITAAQFVSIIARIANLSDSDSSVSHWAAGTMQAALDAGWFNWDENPPDGSRFNEKIERQLAVKILMTALLPNETGEYTDWASKISDFSTLSGRYYEKVFAAYECGIVIGNDSGSFNATSPLSRAEACAMIYRAIGFLGDEKIPSPKDPSPVPSPAIALSGGYSENGKLQVIGTQLSNSDGDPVVLRGMSTHGMQWYGQFASKGAIRTTADYGANLFRIAMYTGENGYISNPSKLKADVISAADTTIALDMYVIIDWHILSDGNPNTYLAEAKLFFAEMAERYADSPVIFEICNEPNGNVTWETDIRPYAVELIPVIRKYAPDSIIIVGTGTWSQDVDAVSANPLPYDNVMYALHFYSGTHTQFLRDRAAAAIKAGTPIFVSEWGTSRADGGSGVYLSEAQKWIDFMNEYNLSWANWSLCDKDESSAALCPGASASGGWAQQDLTPSGKFVFENFN